MRQATVFVLFHFADYLLDQRVFKHDVAETLVMDSLKYSVLVWSIEAKHI